MLFHTFFVVVMVAVFALTLHYSKATLYAAFGDVIISIAEGATVDPQLFIRISEELDTRALFVYVGMIVFAILTSIIAAKITLAPTRRAFSQQKKFIGTIAHELRTPLAVLNTQNEVALYDVDEDNPAYEVLQENIKQVKSLTSILNNLLVFNRIDTTETIQFSAVDIAVIIEKVVGRLQKLAKRKRVVIDVRIETIPNVYGNETALEQAIYNVVKNAVVYSKREGGVVTITLSHHNGTHAVVCVEDRGFGISKEYLPHIFEPFYRAKNNGDDQSGTGLGLAIVFEIVKLHNGTVRVNSREDVGTTIELEFLLWDDVSRIVSDAPEHKISFDFSS